MLPLSSMLFFRRGVPADCVLHIHIRPAAGASCAPAAGAINRPSTCVVSTVVCHPLISLFRFSPSSPVTVARVCNSLSCRLYSRSALRLADAPYKLPFPYPVCSLLPLPAQPHRSCSLTICCSLKALQPARPSSRSCKCFYSHVPLRIGASSLTSSASHPQ